jgi:hypothetical protein
MSDYKVGDRVKIKLTGGRLVDAEIKAVIETADENVCKFRLEKRPPGFTYGK